MIYLLIFIYVNISTGKCYSNPKKNTYTNLMSVPNPIIYALISFYSMYGIITLQRWHLWRHNEVKTLTSKQLC